MEEFVQAREFMYVQIYIHKTTRAYEAMLDNILNLAQQITAGDPAKAPHPCPSELANMLAKQPVSVPEFLALDDFRLWTLLVDWSLADRGKGELEDLLIRKCDALVNRRQPYKAIDLDSEVAKENAIKLLTRLEEERSPLEFACYRDSFMDRAYRNILYRKGKEDEEQEDRAIHVIDRNGRLHPVETESEVIRAISEIETNIFRLYYDESDAELAKRLTEHKWQMDQSVFTLHER